MERDVAATLGDFVDLIRGTTYKGALVGKPGPALLGLGSIRPGGGFRDADFRTYGGDCPEKLMLVPGDLFASLKGATKDGEMIGSVARLPQSVSSGRLTQDTVKLVFRRRDSRFERFVYWVLRTPHYRAYCAGRATGSAVVALSRDDFLSYPIPPLTEERALCVDLLEAIEQRVSLIHQASQTLEEVASRIFKSWFVDNDPVRARAEGCEAAGVDVETSQLFPSTAEEWKRLVPQARVADAISNGLLLIGDGYRAKNSELGAPGVGFVRAGDLLQGRITPTEDHLSESSLTLAAQKMARAGDTAFTSKGTIGRFAYVDRFAGPAVYSPQVCFWRSLDAERLSPAYLHYWMKSSLFGRQVDMVRGQAAIMDFVSLGDQRRMLLDVPPVSIQKAFEGNVGPLLERMAVNRLQADCLESVRNEVLPRLFSGKLWISKTRDAAEEALV